MGEEGEGEEEVWEDGSVGEEEGGRRAKRRRNQEEEDYDEDYD